MKKTDHGEHLWQCTRLFAFNCFLVLEEDGMTLVDTNLPGSANNIIQAAASLERPIKRVLLTHAHEDHAGSLEKLLEVLSKAEVLMSGRTAAMLNGDLALQSDEPQTAPKGRFASWSGAPDRAIAPGDSVGSLRVVAAPGHSPDQIAFFDEREGTLIAGDAFQTQGGIAVAGIRRWRFPLPSMASWHLPTSLKTAKALRALRPTRLAVGHGPVIEQPMKLMDEAVRAAERAVDGG